MTLEFDKNGLLPPEDFEMDLETLKNSLLVEGNGNSSTWDRDWRFHLTEQLGRMASQLAQIDIKEVFVDGSFVEEKDHPNDIDGFFFCDRMFAYSGELTRQLNLLDPYKVWTWDPSSRRPYRGYAKGPSYQCGTNIGLSFTRIPDSHQGSQTEKGSLSDSERHFDSPDLKTKPRES